VPVAVAAVQRLQRSAGNSATTRLLGSAPRQVIQRIVFWNDTVTPNTVESITLDRLAGTGGGAHTTSFQLFLETIQNAVINQQYDVAIKRLMALAKDVKDLPGYIDARHKKLFETFEDTYADAAKASNSSTNVSYYLETLATDYVKLRNGIDYNYLETGEGDVGGFKEPQNLKAASAAHQDVDWDNIEAALQAKKPTTAQQAQVAEFGKFIDATAKLLDTRNVAPPSDKDEKKKWVKRWKRIIQQHVATVIVAHPGVEAAADVVIEDLVHAIGRDIGMVKRDREDLVSTMQGSSDLGWSNIEAAA
jgi:hypothetical protein